MMMTHLMVTKGALQNVLDVCTSAETRDGKIVDIATVTGSNPEAL